MDEVRTQNSRGEWVPAIPTPLFVGRGLKRARCDCGRVFGDDEAYRGHYALVHVMGLS